jgi:endonuclease YncB( thermonuclease family)/thiol-disulfide isomerase/thioredoxin
MKIKRILIPLFLLLCVAPANAMVLRGTVAEVRDGQSIVINNAGRTLTVFLEGVDAPEMKQEFGEIARQHLARLILEKGVEVDFDQLKGDHVVGKVYCNQIDIGLQVIRDGAAWYDKSSALSLSETERGVYVAAEQAARDERRGIWEVGSPMPPWEWRRAEAAKAFGPVKVRKNDGRGLRSEDLLFSPRAGVGGSANVGGRGVAGTRTLGKPTARPLNTPGQDVDFSDYLRQGRVSIVYFYADWCPACRQLSPMMDQLNARSPDKQVLFMNIGNWNTPVTQRYGITSVPHLKIYDKSGNLVAEGMAARAWLAEHK